MPQSNRLTDGNKKGSSRALSDTKEGFTHPCEQGKTQDRLRGISSTKENTSDDPTGGVGEELASDKQDRTSKECQMTAMKGPKGPPPWRSWGK